MVGVQNPEKSLRGLSKIASGLATRGAARTFCEGLRRSTVAHFARKVRGANIVVAKHELKIQQSYAPSAGQVRYVFVALTLRAK